MTSRRQAGLCQVTDPRLVEAESSPSRMRSYVVFAIPKRRVDQRSATLNVGFLATSLRWRGRMERKGTEP